MQGLREIIKDMQEDKEYLQGIGDMYDADMALRKLKELEKEIKQALSTREELSDATDKERAEGLWNIFEDILGLEVK